MSHDHDLYTTIEVGDVVHDPIVAYPNSPE